MNGNEILALLEDAGAVIRNSHMVYTSGRHGDGYVNCRILGWSEHRAHLSEISRTLIERIIGAANIDINRPVTIVGPETLGADLAEAAAARHNSELGTSFKYLKVHATKHESGEKTFGWNGVDPVPFLRGAQVIYLDDLMTAGSTLTKCRSLIEVYAEITAVGVIVDRSGMSAEDLNVPHYVSLVNVKLDNYPSDACPLCADQKAIVTNRGHGERFREKFPDYEGGFTEI